MAGWTEPGSSDTLGPGMARMYAHTSFQPDSVPTERIAAARAQGNAMTLGLPRGS